MNMVQNSCCHGLIFNAIRIYNHLVRKRTLNHLAKLTLKASLTKWLSVRLRTKWFWVRISLLYLFGARSSLTFRQTIDCGFTLKLVLDLIITYSLIFKFELFLKYDIFFQYNWLLNGKINLYRNYWNKMEFKNSRTHSVVVISSILILVT